MKEPTSSRLMRRIAGAQLGLGLACVTHLLSPEAIGVGALNTVRSFYETRPTTMRYGHELGRSGRFIELQPAVRSTFDVPSMARMAIWSGWVAVSSAQQQQLTPVSTAREYTSALHVAKSPGRQ